MGKEKERNFKRRILALTLAFMMLFTMMPTMAWADVGSDIAAVTPVLQNEEQVNITLYGHNAFFSSMKLYKWSGTEKQGEDLLSGVDRVSDKYALSVDEGDYLIEGYTNNGETPEKLGSIVFNVTEDGNHKFELYAVTGIKAANSGWVLGEDYTMSVKILAQDSTEKIFEMGEVNQYGSVVKSCIAFKGDTVTATFTPDAEKQPDFMEATASATLTTNRSGLSASCQQVVTVTFTAPENSVISVGTLSSYYVYNFAAPVSTQTTSENKVESVYKLAKGKDYFYRVQNPNGVTYWNYAKWSGNSTVDITAENLYIGSSEFNKTTVFHNFEKNVYDRADIYLNINQAGYMNMNAGDTYELNSFRNWFAIESIMNAKVALPDMHYEVVGLDGATSDVVTITPDEKNSNVAVMKANKTGTAIVMVTYDAMTHMQGMSKAAVEGGESTKQFSAIWPECTGVFVVSVNTDGTAIKTNMQLDRFGQPSTFDAEHDILFYTGNEGASFSFTPESGCTVSVVRSTVSDKMAFSGFTTEGIITSENGEVTVKNLTTGRHIIKVEKNGVSAYQVVTARGVSYKVLDAEGNELSADAKVKAGDKVKLQFSGLVNPQEKLSGVYNFNASLYYQGEDETFFKSNPGGAFGVYDFSGNPARQLIEITIPKYWTGESYTLNGCIKMGGFAGIPTHRMVTYAKGAQKGFDAPAASSVLGQLPEITIALEKTEFISAKLNFKDNEGNTVDRSKLNISLVDGDNNKIIVAEDGSFKCLAEEYSYTINAAGYEYKTGTVNVTSEAISFDIILNKTSENAWDGSTKTEPQKDAEKVYLISNGAEMAWFAENASKTSGIKAKLTADIDLAKYPWKAGDINNGKSEFDGAGHKVYNFKSVNGLFGTVGGGSVIKNLTLEGEIVNSTGTIGGISKYLQSGTIENCVNKARITITGENNNAIGGIAAYTYNGASIINCINKGNISAEGSEVGGILGYTVGSDAKIEGCINEGTITGGSIVGGIIGKDINGIEIKNCYNTGAVTGTANAGGFIGQTSKTTIISCYNAGIVSGGNGFAGNASKSYLEKCYYLENESKDESAVALNSQELKSADLGEGFKLVCGDYPALSWEIGKTEHNGVKKETVDVTCYAKGYDLYECSICHETYKINYVASSGHTSTPEKEKVYAAYKDETCSVCGENYRIWNDDRLQYIVLPAKGVTTITMNDKGDYPWNWKTSKARFESSNGGVSTSTSKTELSFTLSEEKVLSFGYGVSSEEKYDKATIILSKTDGEPEIIANEISGINSGNFSKLLAAGEYTLSLAFAKDSSGDNNDDLGYITNVKLSDKTETPQTPEAKPSVTFRLIGCEKAKQDVDLGTDKYLPNYVTWIATTTYTLEELGEDATVGTVFKKALDKAGLEYEGFENNYISSIESPSGYVLAEMTNGPRSGWMYTVNGTHPDKGLNEWKIKEGDVIIWHYVNDYSYEVQDWVEDENHPALGNASTWNGWLKAADSVGASGGGAASAPVENQSQVATTGTTGAATTTTPTEVTVSGTTATATVKNENAAEAIKQAKENKSAEIVLNVAASDTKGAETVKIQLDTVTVKSVVADTDASLTVKTENGQVSLDREALTTIASEAKGATITLEVVKVAKPTETQQQAAGTNGQVLQLVVKSGDKIISDFNKGKATITVEISSKLQDKKVTAIYIAEDGQIEQMSGKTVKIDGKVYYTFETPHFSTFALVDAEELGLEVNDEDANIERIKELVSDMSMKARSSKTSKKNIKVTLTVDKSTAAAIKEIKDMGYTVKYKYYRSTRKASKYQAKITKTTKTYTNTAGKKGTKYYYKARIQVYDKDGKLVAQTALKQCKYAARTWTK